MMIIMLKQFIDHNIMHVIIIMISYMILPKSLSI